MPYTLLTHLDGTDEIFNLTVVEGETADDIADQLADEFQHEEDDEDPSLTREEFVYDIIIFDVSHLTEAQRNDVISAHNDRSEIVIPDFLWIAFGIWRETRSTIIWNR